MSEWLSSLTNWFITVIKDIWQAFVDFLGDFWVDIADFVLSAIASTFSVIPVPHFLDNYSVGTIFSFLPSDILYFVGQLGLPAAFALISSAVAFRLLRKVMTLFQW